MGLSSSKQTSTSKPIYSGQIEGAANNITSAYNAQAPKVTAVTDQLGSLVPGLLDRYTNGDPNVNAATKYNTSVLNGDYLGKNPWLDSIVANSNDAARNAVTASLGTRGLTGGSAMADIVSRNVANNATNLYGQSYEAERARMGQAAAMAPGLASAQYQPLGIVESIAQAQQMPVQTATAAGAATGGLLGSYTNQTGKSTPSIMQQIGQAAQMAALFSDRRLKTDITKIGEYGDGLGKYLFRYIWDDEQREGVMADEVARLRPWALGPTVNGFSTVVMEAL